MKDAWERLRQCISPTTMLCPGGGGTTILSQVFHFLCGSLLRTSSLMDKDGGTQADPKAITVAMAQQHQRAQVGKPWQIIFMFNNWLKFRRNKFINSYVISLHSNKDVDTTVVFILSVQVRLEALCQISSFLSEMEEKSVSSLAPPRFPGLLQSVQLQFLSGCFGLGAPITGSLVAPNNKIHHYTVRQCC